MEHQKKFVVLTGRNPYFLLAQLFNRVFQTEYKRGEEEIATNFRLKNTDQLYLFCMWDIENSSKQDAHKKKLKDIFDRNQLHRIILLEECELRVHTFPYDIDILNEMFIICDIKIKQNQLVYIAASRYKQDTFLEHIKSQLKRFPNYRLNDENIFVCEENTDFGPLWEKLELFESEKIQHSNKIKVNMSDFETQKNCKKEASPILGLRNSRGEQNIKLLGFDRIMNIFQKKTYWFIGPQNAGKSKTLMKIGQFSTTDDSASISETQSCIIYKKEKYNLIDMPGFQTNLEKSDSRNLTICNSILSEEINFHDIKNIHAFIFVIKLNLSCKEIDFKVAAESFIKIFGDEAFKSLIILVIQEFADQKLSQKEIESRILNSPGYDELQKRYSKIYRDKRIQILLWDNIQEMPGQFKKKDDYIEKLQKSKVKAILESVRGYVDKKSSKK